MTKKQDFEKLLEKGMKFEELVLEQLRKVTSITVPTHDFKTGSYEGPKLYTATEKVTLADFYCPNYEAVGAMFEAKLKRKTVGIPGQGVAEFVCIEKSKQEEYRRSSKMLRTLLYFVVGIESTKKVYLIPDQEFLEYDWNNQYSKGMSVCIPIEEKYLWFEM